MSRYRDAEEDQRCRGAAEERMCRGMQGCRGAGVQGCRGAEVQMCRCAVRCRYVYVQKWYRGKEVV